MWISHMDSEVAKFHPVCETALNAALRKISKDSEYRVLHHEYTGSLEMDFVIQNIATGKYLCVIEVKRTPSDVNSARYQYQAMSYVQMNAPLSEKPFYILTNLEYAFMFRYDPTRPRVFQQMLKPGLLHIGDFADYEQTKFENKLADTFADMIDCFLSDSFDYLVTLEQFEKHMKRIKGNTAKWKSSLVILLYEYIRGAFMSIGRQDLPYDVRVFHNNIKRICSEAANVNFKEIFTYSPESHKRTAKVANDVLANIFDFGKQSMSGDSVVELLHSIVSSEKDEHGGVVPTDLELARIVAVLAKSVSGDIKESEYICDPAAGSGNLISAAIDVYNVSPTQIKANDVNTHLLELLSLRIGLNFAKVVNNQNTAEISAKNIAGLSSEYFKGVSVIIMNPPFVAGINCVSRKNELFKRIKEVKGKKPVTNVGQMNLEGAFLETICALCNPDTVISCILPKSHLVARGKEAIALRKYLLSDFGLTAIFSYPEEGLFEEVDKGTCIVVGRVGTSPSSVKIISSSGLVADIDLHTFEKAISAKLSATRFTSIAPGIEGFSQTKKRLLSTVNEGWRQICREFDDALSFQRAYIETNAILIKLSTINKKELPRKRGTVGNSGGSGLLMLDRDKALYKKYQKYPTIPAIRNAKFDGFFVADGDSACYDSANIKETVLRDIVDEYLRIPIREGRQLKKEKSPAELMKLLKSMSRKKTPVNSVLVPRGIRSFGRVYVTKKSAIISTNFFSITMRNMDDAIIIASWFSTIFYQLICEANAKPQEGMRKMEVKDIEATYVPVTKKLKHEYKESILEEVQNITFLKLNNPEIRKIDEIWANILFGTKADARLLEARRLLEFLANVRNPNKNYND